MSQMNNYKAGFRYKSFQRNFEIPCGKCQPSDKKNTAEVYRRFLFFLFVSKDENILLYYLLYVSERSGSECIYRQYLGTTVS